jgi:amino-acid N-acetyltransferase
VRSSALPVITTPGVPPHRHGVAARTPVLSLVREAAEVALDSTDPAGDVALHSADRSGGVALRRAERAGHIALRRAERAGHIALRRAERADAAQVHALLEQFVVRQILLPRTLEQVTRTIADFVVATEHDRIVGSASLRLYSAELAEVGALAVAEELHGAGIGRRLVEMQLEHARSIGVRRVFALTLEDGFFHRLGFEATTIAEFPQKVAIDCSSCARRSACTELTVALSL